MGMWNQKYSVNQPHSKKTSLCYWYLDQELSYNINRKPNEFAYSFFPIRLTGQQVMPNDCHDDPTCCCRPTWQRDTTWQQFPLKFARWAMLVIITPLLTHRPYISSRSWNALNLGLSLIGQRVLIVVFDYISCIWWLLICKDLFNSFIGCII